jgi:hypothetical protein
MSGTSQPKEATFEQIKKDHQNLWVAVSVTKRDANGQPIAGKVLAEDADRYRLRDQIIMEKDVCIFFAGDPLYPQFL